MIHALGSVNEVDRLSGRIQLFILPRRGEGRGGGTRSLGQFVTSYRRELIQRASQTFPRMRPSTHVATHVTVAVQWADDVALMRGRRAVAGVRFRIPAVSLSWIGSDGGEAEVLEHAELMERVSSAGVNGGYFVVQQTVCIFIAFFFILVRVTVVWVAVLRHQAGVL